MPTPLVPRNFDATCIQLLKNFDCGADEFGRIATEWIRCTDEEDSALQAIRDRNTEVFLYNKPNGGLVGFGSLGKTTRKIKKVEVEWSIIPHFGIDFRLRSCPHSVIWSDRYSASIMQDLMALAQDHNTPFLMLKVHTKNLGAIKLYGRLGFCNAGHPNPGGYQAMIIENSQ